MTETTAINPDVAKQYNKWVYPKPVEDLEAFFRQGGRVYGDPSDEFHRIWPERKQFAPTILVPGCGTSLAPQLAFKNPNSQVVGVDLSDGSLNHARHLKDKHSLNNLELIKLDLHQVATLGQRFDYIIVTGVLHHLPDPVGGGRALAQALAPNGAMHVMLYGMSGRVGVYMLQRVFRELGLTQSEGDVNLVQEVLKQLPEDHSVQKYLNSTKELTYPGAVVDTFLHPQDRAYWADEIFEFADAVGLSFAEWVSPGLYHPIAMLPRNHPLFEKVWRLDRRTQAIVIDRLLQKTGTHRFILRDSPSPGRDWRIDFSSDAFWDWTPHRHPALRLENVTNSAGGVTQRLVFEGIAGTPAPLVRAMLGVMDGERTVRACLDALVAQGGRMTPDSEQAVKTVISDLYHIGHILIEKSPAEPNSG